MDWTKDNAVKTEEKEKQSKLKARIALEQWQYNKNLYYAGLAALILFILSLGMPFARLLFSFLPIAPIAYIIAVTKRKMRYYNNKYSLNQVDYIQKVQKLQQQKQKQQAKQGNKGLFGGGV